MITQILNQNPWWRDKCLISHDPKIRELESQPLRWRPEMLTEFDPTATGVYTLRGPRQIGKTTAVKLLIRDLLQDVTIAKEQVMYYSCDNIDTRQELIELLEAYFGHLRTLGLHEGRQFIFIDEITAIRDWQRGIKHLADMGLLERAFVILTGSSAADLRRGAERLPGRRGDIATPDKVLLPLCFREYVRLVQPELAAQLANDIKPTAFTADDMKLVTSFLPRQKELSVLLDRYFITGGYITAINDYHAAGEIAYSTYERYQQWLRGDIARSGKNERTARQIIRELLRISVSAFGWETIAKKVDIATHKTVSEYMEALEDNFALKTLYQVDLNTGNPAIKKLKKAYFLDLFIQWTMRGWVDNWLTYGDTVTERLIGGDMKAQLCEQLVANDLFRRYDRRDWLNSSVFFWKNGGEVDFIVKQDGRLFPIEVKYQQSAAPADCAMMRKLGFKEGLLITRNTLRQVDAYTLLPLELFLMLGK
jgi:predicted AAA+ superfamily ATPase